MLLPFIFKDKRLKRCLDCGGALLADPNQGGFICKECGRIEKADATVFLPERICNRERSPLKWGFKYYLDHLLGNDLLEKLASKYDPSGKLLLFELKTRNGKTKN